MLWVVNEAVVKNELILTFVLNTYSVHIHVLYMLIWFVSVPGTVIFSTHIPAHMYMY